MFADDELLPPAGHPERFGTRWRLVGAGLSNVWRYGDLVLDAASGRLLLRGPNGTGKTTALEALWPYLLDLNAQRLVAGKARTTTLSSLMREGATGKRRYGYLWLVLAAPGSDGIHTFGVRLQFSAGASPAVKVIPFTVPGAPITDFPLHDTGRAPLMLDRFTELVTAAGGQIFDDEDAYVTHLAARVWNASATHLRDLAQRIRAVRNPSLLGDVSPRAAADALREALPGVADDTITATADALAESDATREAFNRDRDAADVLDEFAGTWAGHVTAILTDAHAVASAAASAVDRAAAQTSQLERKLAKADEAERDARSAEETLRLQLRDIDARIEVLEDDENFKAAGRITELTTRLGTEKKHATAALAQLTTTTTTLREQTASLTDQVGELVVDLDEQVSAAAEADTGAAVDKPLLSWTSRPRAVVTIGGTVADPGPGLTVEADPTRLDTIAEHWTARARYHTVRAGDAQLAISDFTRTVAPAADAARTAKTKADHAAQAADIATQTEQRTTVAARTAASAWLDAVAAWPVAPGDLYARLATDSDDGIALWTTSDLDELRTAEPGQVLDEASRWRQLVTDRAAHARATLLHQRHALLERADELTEDAAARRAEADELRSGQLLPLPRPAWLDSNDDTAALAAALEWSPTFPDEQARALVETALAASGLLAATLTADGAATAAWQVRPAGPAVPTNLHAVLAVDQDHSHANAAADVLARIALHATAADDGEPAAALVIGRDGTFRAGTLFGRAPGTDDPSQLPPPQHVGGAQRRAAALARAEQLDDEATDLDVAAATARSTADQLRQRAAAIDEHAAAFPSARTLEQKEVARVGAAQEATRLRHEASDAQKTSIAAAEHEAEQRLEWSDRTRSRSLPADRDALDQIKSNSSDAAKALHTAATAVQRLRSRLERLLAEVSRLGDTSGTLPRLCSEAQAADDIAAATAEKVRVLRENVGQAAQQAHAAHAAACSTRDDLRAQTGPARDSVEKAARETSRLGALLESARLNEQEAKPAADARLRELRSLLAAPGVAEVLSGVVGPDAVAADLLDAVARALAGRRTYGRKTLRERYDTARAALAGMWTLDPADSYADLDTFVLTHDDVPFTPIAAARRAQELKAKAQAALDAAEESALRDFVVGRLPSAIGTAWTRLHDWADDVNRKMRSAAASSGVGVQVRVRLVDDLSPAARTVYELACKVADADRTREQKAMVGQALQQLIAAADGDTMVDKLAAAVDVRSWVDVYYEVTRPGSNAQRWSPKTGLSGGERRLVVLAPMIAAVAAAYDSLVPSGLRLIALDEVPAEVDERGREGLARYLAELDLDLVCTSYLWDGAPGAWDGIDAHDLEAAGDGTVVAFPMLIRGLDALPGDPTVEPNR
ncbi:SbcC/MukB-like Walker B domain-containing protein [Kutzneria kofuensis]|uniref:Uncharacterized protein n=2 Tax=Kutzneria kofuensis TaxID=103725 RepID=A0A7W9KFE3_9PSEU|nr:hypothetical protein [Kutzneria kofuensis]